MFYNIKEVEAQGSKYTGIHPMQIKDILQTLLDESLINAEKCGVTTLYWCFEYDKHKQIQTLVNNKRVKLAQLKLKRDIALEDLETARKGRKRGDAAAVFTKLETLTKERNELQIRMNSNFYDMARVQEMKKKLKEMVENTQNATDNIEQLIYHFKKVNDIPRAHFEQELHVPQEFDDALNVDGFFTDLEVNPK